MRVVVDTNVWVSALIVPDSAPGAVLHAVRTSRIELVISWDLVQEVVDVLRRPKIRRTYSISEDEIDGLLTLFAPMLPSVDVEIELRDPDDAPVVAAAIGGGAELIVTGDLDLLEDTELASWLRARGVAVVTPAEFAERL